MVTDLKCAQPTTAAPDQCQHHALSRQGYGDGHVGVSLLASGSIDAQVHTGQAEIMRSGQCLLTSRSIAKALQMPAVP